MDGFPVKLVGEGPDLAAWVQAIGSIAAIWFAGRFSHRDRLRSSADRMDAVYGLALIAANLVHEAGNAFNEAVVGNLKPIDEFASDNFLDADNLLTQVPVVELGSTRAPEAVLHLRNCVRGMHMLVLRQTGLSSGPSADLYNESQRIDSEAVAMVALIEGWRLERERLARRWWC